MNAQLYIGKNLVHDNNYGSGEHYIDTGDQTCVAVILQHGDEAASGDIQFLCANYENELMVFMLKLDDLLAKKIRERGTMLDVANARGFSSGGKTIRLRGDYLDAVGMLNLVVRSDAIMRDVTRYRVTYARFMAEAGFGKKEDLEHFDEFVHERIHQPLVRYANSVLQDLCPASIHRIMCDQGPWGKFSVVNPGHHSEFMELGGKAKVPLCMGMKSGTIGVVRDEKYLVVCDWDSKSVAARKDDGAVAAFEISGIRGFYWNEEAAPAKGPSAIRLEALDARHFRMTPGREYRVAAVLDDIEGERYFRVTNDDGEEICVSERRVAAAPQVV